MTSRTRLPAGLCAGVAVLVAVLVPAAPALANVSIGSSLTVPVGTIVGTTANPGSLSMTNNNNAPHSTESNTVTEIRLAPGCGSAPSGGNPCPTPDPGVFSVTSATGAPGSACAGATFTPSGPDASGVVTLTPSSPVVLAPPGGAPGSDTCTINFTFSTLKVPTVDADPAAGAQTRFSARIVARSNTSLLTVANHPSVITTVVNAPGRRQPADFDGDRDTDVAVYRPGMGHWYINGGNPGFVTWGADGDVPVPADYTGDGRTDVAVYRPSTGQWFVQGGSPGLVVWGATGDVPVPGDYTGDGRTDVAVYRPSTGQWFVQGASSPVTWGTQGDVPVPGDYTGDGRADVAVYRPSTGQWFVNGGSPGLVTWGAGGDVPVPGDYTGDGRTDIAVYRPSTGQWFVNGGSPGLVAWGAQGDVPVPGDYTGDGRTDTAVYRPSTGQWFVNGGSPGLVTWGAPGDVPLPLPFAILRTIV